MTAFSQRGKATSLVRAKRRFNLVVRLIANKCYEDIFYLLSFLPTVLILPPSASNTCLISLHWIICKIILQARPKVQISEQVTPLGCYHYLVAVEQVKAEGASDGSQTL